MPPGIREAVERALERVQGHHPAITTATGVGGGCVSPVARLETDGGARYFLKWADASTPSGLLAAEARGLRQLADAGALRVPAVVALSDGHEAEGTAGEAGEDPWLLLEWLEPAAATERGWRRLGAGLAAQHRVRTPRYGAGADNFIGPLPQSNGWVTSWPEFWWSQRLEPQLRRAMDGGRLPADVGPRFDALAGRLDDALDAAGADGASLLHGDLWSGNVHMVADGEPTVIDPSVYHGHREVDLAMAELFGGFDAAFMDAYTDAWPLAPGYAPRRRAIYQLYYLLVHVNLFGSGYVSGTLRALDAAEA